MGSLNEIQLSKKLSWLLRHGAIKEGLPLSPDGFVPVNAILRHKNYAPYYTLDIIQQLVQNDNKRRYDLQKDSVTEEYQIRSNQGHSIEAVKADECMKLVCNPNEIPLAVHGTYYKHWNSIKREGLKRMTRNLIHFAITDRVDQLKNNISGFRNDCEILIYLNIAKAMLEGGMDIYLSSNNVILCAGHEGTVTKEYFSKVIDRKTGKTIEY